MRKMGLSIIAMIAAMSAPAIAADWVLVSSHDTAERYVDRASIKQVGPYKRAWDKIVIHNDPEYKEMVSLTEYDCSGGRKRDIQMTSYLTNGESRSSGSTEWTYPPPETSAETTLDYVCFGKLRR